MTSFPSSFNLSFLSKAPPIMQENENGAVLNFSLTIPEGMYLCFIQGMIRDSLEQKIPLLYIGTSEKMQSDFSAWVSTTFTSEQFTSEELRLASIVSSIWTKAKDTVKIQLTLLSKQELIDDEKKWQEIADRQTEAFHSRGYLGKILTARQAGFLLTTLDGIGKKFKAMSEAQKVAAVVLTSANSSSGTIEK